MHTLSFEIIPSPKTNDHEARVLVDNEDWLGKEYLGLDPPRLFVDQNMLSEGELLIGRCDCGVEGCCDFNVTVKILEDRIVWANNDGLNLEFDKSGYIGIVKQYSNDFSWEDKGRRTERLVSQIFKEKQIPFGYIFNWASTRIEPRIVTLSFSKGADQKLYKIRWDGMNEKTAIENAKVFFDKNK